MNNGLIDIEVPVIPEHTGSSLIFLLLTTVIAVLLIAWFIYRYRSVRMQAKRRLKRLHNSSRHTGQNSKETVYQLARILSIGLGLTSLTSQTRLPDKLSPQEQRWRGFISELEQARYCPAADASIDLERLFSEARFWLAQWP